MANLISGPNFILHPDPNARLNEHIIPVLNYIGSVEKEDGTKYDLCESEQFFLAWKADHHPCWLVLKDPAEAKYSAFLEGFRGEVGIELDLVPNGLGSTILADNGRVTGANTLLGLAASQVAASTTTPVVRAAAKGVTKKVMHKTEKEATELWGNLNHVIATAYALGSYVLLTGVPGTGKTYSAQSLAKKHNREHIAITTDQDQYPDKLLGHFVPDGSGAWKYMLGPLARAYAEGQIVSLNEINFAAGSIMTALYSVLDDRGISQLPLPDGRKLTPHAEFFAIATTNMPWSELNLPDALLDRFPVRYEVNLPNPEAVAKLTPVFQNLVWDIYTSGNPLNRKVTHRQLSYIDRAIQAGLTAELAVSSTITVQSVRNELIKVVKVGLAA